MGAENYLAFTYIRGGQGRLVMLPLMHQADAGKRSHYLAVHFAIPDAPAPDEIVVALGASIGGRPHHRVGDRTQDLKEMGSNTA